MGQLWDMRQLLKTYGMGWEISKNLKKGSIPSRRDGMGSRPHLSSHAQPRGVKSLHFFASLASTCQTSKYRISQEFD